LRRSASNKFTAPNEAFPEAFDQEDSGVSGLVERVSEQVAEKQANLVLHVWDFINASADSFALLTKYSPSPPPLPPRLISGLVG